MTKIINYILKCQVERSRDPIFLLIISIDDLSTLVHLERSRKARGDILIFYDNSCSKAC
jgi:hypothetical protein